jgi:hypothetical protein
MGNWAIDYNGFGSDAGDWTALHIAELNCEPVFAEDGVTIETHKHTISGTALIKGANDAATITAINDARGKLNLARKALVISLGSTDLVDIEAGGDDQFGTPICHATISEIYGGKAALVQFEITWHDYLELSGEDATYNIVSHQWRQTFAIEESGLQTHTVSGQLKTRYNASAVTDDLTRKGPNPDLYRGLIMPELEAGFRIKRLEFATDESKTRLVYTIEAQEHARELPGPAKTGDGTFTWRRGMMSSQGMLGLKVFDAEVEGPPSTSPAALLGALVKCAQNRINFTGKNADQIMEIEVVESNIFTRNRIGLRITAIGTGNSPNPLDIAPGFDLLQDITEGTDEYEPINPYGDGRIRSVLAAYFSPVGDYTEATFPKAETESEEDTEAQAYQIPETTFEQFDSSLIEQGVEANQIQSAHTDYPYVDAQATEEIHVVPHMICLPSQSIAGKDLPYQTRKPSVFLMTEYRVSRTNEPPPRYMLGIPKGTMLVDERFVVKPGPLDANNNRTFHAVYTRVLQLIDIDQDGMWVVETGQVPVLGDITLIRFVPPSKILRMPFDPRTQAGSEVGAKTLFDEDSVNGFNFKITPMTYWTQP